VGLTEWKKRGLKANNKKKKHTTGLGKLLNGRLPPIKSKDKERKRRKRVWNPRCKHKEVHGSEIDEKENKKLPMRSREKYVLGHTVERARVKSKRGKEG